MMNHKLFYIAMVLCLAAAPMSFGQTKTIADFEADVNGFYGEENGTALTHTTAETAGSASVGAVVLFYDPTVPEDDSPESKLTGPVPAGGMAGYTYLSFYYMTSEPTFDGNEMFLMPGSANWAGGIGATAVSPVIADGAWHYAETEFSQFAHWWSPSDAWPAQQIWDESDALVIGMWEQADDATGDVYYDHIMLSNNPGDGMLLAASGPPEVAATTPGSGGSVGSLPSVTVVFNQEVTGVALDGSDLLVAGQPATSVVTSNNRTFVFAGFPDPGIGAVNAEVLAGAIQSLSAEAFAGYTWAFTIFATAEGIAPYTATAPTLDGVADPGEYTGAVYDTWMANLGGETSTGPADWTVRWQASHDNNYIYVLFEADDDERSAGNEDWEDDNLELFLDQPNVKTGAGTQYRMNYNGSAWVNTAAGGLSFGAGPTDDWYAVVGDTGTGWTVEARFLKNNVAPDNIVGFNLQPSDNDGTGRGIYHFWWSAPSNNNPWNDASAWPNLVLQRDPTDPIVLLTAPPKGATLLAGEVVPITVVFDWDVTGVDAEDLWLNVSDNIIVADSVNALAPDRYEFGFSTWVDPIIGVTIQATMPSTSGIVLAADPGFTFAGDSWIYNFALTEPAAARDWMLYE